MKFLASAIFATCVLCGCGQENKFQTASISWWPGATNLELTISANNAQITTNIDSLEQGANILGQYGWQLVSVTGDSDANRVFYMKRRYQGSDTCTVTLIPPVQAAPN
jgi:hypothetical protein